MARRYLLTMLAAAACTALLAGAFSWWVDPLAINGSPRVQGFNALKPAIKGRARIYKTVNAARGEWPCLIVGTSRAETGFDPQHAYFRGTPCFNAALGGQPYEESLDLVAAAASRGALKRVVAVLDFAVANAHYEGPPDRDPANYRPWRPIALALNLEMLGGALDTPRRQDEALLREEQALWLPDGRYDFPPPRRGHRHDALVSEAGYFAMNYFRGPERRFALATPTSQPLRNVRSLIALAHSRGIELVIVIAPAHARQWETIGAAGLWDAWEEWKRALVAMNEQEAAKAGKPAFALWDFSGYDEMTTEPFPALDDTRSRMRWYFDSSHFTPAAGNRALDRIAGKPGETIGARLDSGMLEAHLARIRAGRGRWRADYPLDAAEVERAARRFHVRDVARHGGG